MYLAESLSSHQGYPVFENRAIIFKVTTTRPGRFNYHACYTDVLSLRDDLEKELHGVEIYARPQALMFSRARADKSQEAGG